MIGYPSGQEDAILPTRITRCVPNENSVPLLTKRIRSIWLDISQVLFFRVYGSRLRLGPFTRKKKKKNWPIRSVILTSRPVNNPYLLLPVTSSTISSGEEFNYVFNRLRQYCDIDEK